MGHFNDSVHYEIFLVTFFETPGSVGYFNDSTHHEIFFGSLFLGHPVILVIWPYLLIQLTQKGHFRNVGYFNDTTHHEIFLGHFFGTPGSFG